MTLKPPSKSLREVFSQARLFEGFGQEFWPYLEQLAIWEVHPAGHLILKEGEVNQDLFILTQGVVGLYHRQEVILHLRRVGDLFGEESVVAATPMTTSVVAESWVEVYRLPLGGVPTNSHAAEPWRTAFLPVISRLLTQKLFLSARKASRFEETARQLEIAQTDLQKLNQHLEEQVQTRTRDLLQSNLQLQQEILSHKKTTQSLRETTQKLERTQQARHLLLANLSHDLLRPVDQILEATPWIPNTEGQHPTPVSEAALSLRSTLKNLFDLFRLEAEDLRLEWIEFEWLPFWKNLCTRWQSRLEAKGLRWTWKGGGGRPGKLRGDALRLEQMLDNLLEMALHLTERGTIHGEWIFEETETHWHWHFWLEDQGRGWPGEWQVALRRGDWSALSAIEGSAGYHGLGLALVQKLVQLMNGRFWWEMRPLGMTVHLELVLERTASVSLKTGPLSKSWQILLAEDNRTNQVLITLLLQQAGYQVTLATDGQEAWKLMQSQSFDLAILDLNMPGITGLELAEKCRAWEQEQGRSSLPLIAMTAQWEADIRERALAAGMNAYLSKPVQAAALQTALLNVMNPTLQPAENVAAKRESEVSAEVSLEHLLQATGNDPEKIKRIVESFLRDLEASLAILNQAFQEQNAELLRRQAHTLKGASANFQATALVEAAYALEKLPDPLRWADVEAKMTELPALAKHIQRALLAQINQPPPHILEPLPALPHAHLTGEFVLVAEDDYVSRHLLHSHLSRWGYQVIEAEDGQQAWEVLQRKSPPTLVILDWIMPKLNGLEICQRIRQSDTQTYVILLTSKGLPEELVAGFQAGADDYLIKPFHPAELQARLEVGLRMSRLEKQLRQQRDQLQRDLQLGMQQNLQYGALIHFMAQLGEHDHDGHLISQASLFLHQALGTKVQFWECLNDYVIPIGNIERDLSWEKREEVFQAFQHYASITFKEDRPRFIKDGPYVMEVLEMPEHLVEIDLLPIYLGFVRINLLAIQRHRRIEAEQRQYKRLMENIFPRKVANELLTHGHSAPRLLANVTVVFTDFVGFTNIAQHWGAERLVKELSNYFDYFDETIALYGLEKLKTIGDGYMYAGGLPDPNRTHAIDCVLAAIDIQRFMRMVQDFRRDSDELVWDLRIGIHTGPVMAGVIGSKKFAYDIWGDTVNTASRLESNGIAGHINVSASTYHLVEPFFDCEHRGLVQVKGKGALEMYLVRGLKAEYHEKQDPFTPNAEFYRLYAQWKEDNFWQKNS